MFSSVCTHQLATKYKHTGILQHVQDSDYTEFVHVTQSMTSSIKDEVDKVLIFFAYTLDLDTRNNISTPKQDDRPTQPGKPMVQ